jgi:hypothetical protein
MEPISWLLAALLLFSGGANVKQKMDLVKTGKEIDTHIHEETKNANEIKEMNDLIGKLRAKFTDALAKYQESIKRLDKNEDKLRDDIKRDMSIAYEQAVDIQKSNDTPYTTMHVETLREYIKTWGYDASARVFKWNLDIIRKQQAQVRQLQAERKALKQERDALSDKVNGLNVNLAEKHGKLTILTDHNMTLSQTGEQLNNKLQEKIESVAGWVSEYRNIKFALWAAAIAAAIFFAANIKQWFKNKFLSSFGQKTQHELIKRNQLIKKFKKIDEHGNDTMHMLLETEDIDLDEDGNGGAEAAKKKKLDMLAAKERELKIKELESKLSQTNN